MTETQGQIIIGFLGGIMGFLTIIYLKLCQIYNLKKDKEKIRELKEKMKRMENNSTTINDLKGVSRDTGETIKEAKENINENE